MDWLKIFRNEKKNSAQTAKERLLITVAHQRASDSSGLHFLPRMREELLTVVRKYVQVPDDAVQFNVQRDEGLEVLELNITLPEKEQRQSAGATASN